MYNLKYFQTLDPGEQSLVKWQFQEHGGFFTALWKAISTADGSNLWKLEQGFPDHVRAYRRYTTENGWWESVLDNLRKEK